MKIKTVYLDLDGVIFDFHGAVIRLLNLNIDESTEYKPIKELVTSKVLWSTINKMGKDFWTSIPLMEYAQKLYWMCKELVPDVVFLSSPSEDPSSLSGKGEAVRRNFCSKAADLILANDKWRLATPTTLLIDDSIKKIKPFGDMGGHTFLWPSPTGSRKQYQLDIEEAFDALYYKLTRTDTDDE